MNAREILDDIQTLGIELWEFEGQLKFRAPRGVLTESLKETLKACKEELIKELSEPQHCSIDSDPDSQYLPFPLTDVQSAYLIGRTPGIAYGGLPCQAYLEIELPFLNVEKFCIAFNDAIRIHPMLRVRVYREGYQEVSPKVEYITVPVHQLSDVIEEKGHCRRIRQRLLNQYRDNENGHWPLIQVEVTSLLNRCVIHVLVDLLLADFVSVDVVLNQVIQTANGTETAIFSPDLGFRDYVIAQQKTRSGNQFRRAKEYWAGRIPFLPLAPQLPVDSNADQYAVITDEPFLRRATRINAMSWQVLVERSKQYGITPSCLLLGAYAEVIRRWSRQSNFTLNLTMMNRPAGDERIHQIFGDFTSTLLLAIEPPAESNFIERVQSLQNQLWQDLEHSAFSGIDVTRDLAKERGRDDALMPVVFTSTVGATQSFSDNFSQQISVVLRDGITWTPQVWLDCQVLEASGKIYVNWDYRSGILADNVVEDMFNAYVGLLNSLVDDEEIWQQKTVVRPIPAAVHHEKTLSSIYHNRLLHQGFLDAVKKWPDRLALSDCERTLTYEQLYSCALSLAKRIDEFAAGNFVAVVMDKGIAQVVAVLATLISGRAYIPVDSQQPKARKSLILKDAAVNLILTQTWLADKENYENVKIFIVDPEKIPASLEFYTEKKIAPSNVAYLIYTSGSTGKPKGVVMSHQATANTVADINQRIGLRDTDVVLGLAGLGFDLSVYDIFGTLSMGAALVLPEHDKRSNPNHWAHIIEQEDVTVWNSVPAQAAMLQEYLRTFDEPQIQSLRVMLLSGDWVPVTLAANFKACNPSLRVISMGGATEAAIWSIWHEITDEDVERPSIPYGFPLTGQYVHVFNDSYEECPKGVIGELMISGLGLAECYFGDDEKTNERFVYHPETSARLYRTGDIGRYLPNGEIEFLGREDHQVKIRGHRVELGEISSVLENHPTVATAAVVFDPKNQGTLAAFVVAQRIDEKERQRRTLFQRNLNLSLQQKSANLCESIDIHALLTFTRQLDTAARVSLCELIQEVFSVGRWSIDELFNALNAPKYYQRLVYRWVMSLIGSGHLIEEVDQYFINEEKLGESNADAEWSNAISLAREANYSELLINYFKDSALNIREQVSGSLDPLKLFFPEGSHDIALAAFRDNPSARLCNQLASNAVAYLCEVAPVEGKVMNILEVGAGVGGLTQPLISQLSNVDCHYHITDISQYYLTDAEKIYGNDTRVSARRFDVLQDPALQGFELGEFDIVVCGDLLHAVADIPKALHHLSKVLSSGGYIVLLEATREYAEALTSLEFMLPLKENVGRFQDFRSEDGKTFLSSNEWQELLTEEGWEVTCVLPDGSLAEIGLQLIVACNNFDVSALSSTQIKACLDESLPQYMVPKKIDLLKNLPLSANGKVDRKQLQKLMGLQDVSTSTSVNEPPVSEIECAIARLWGQALNCNITDRHAGFFQLGGDSLIAARLSGQLLEQVDEINHRHFDEVLRLFMMGLSVAELASHLLASSDETDSGLSTRLQQNEQSEIKNLNIREGIGNSGRLFLLLDIVEPESEELNDLAAELVMEGSVAHLTRPPGEQSGALKWTFSEYEQWIKELLKELNEMHYKSSTWESIVVIGFASNSTLALDIARRLYLAKPACTLDGLLISPQAPVEDKGLATSIQTHANTQDFLTFDLSIITDANTSQTCLQHVQILCLGEISIMHCDSRNMLVDMALDHLMNVISEGCPA